MTLTNYQHSLKLLNPLDRSDSETDVDKLNGNSTDDYGFFDLDEVATPELQQDMELAVEDGRDRSCSLRSTETSSSSILSSQSSCDEVICEIEHWKAPTSCRSFNTDSAKTSHVTVALNIPKFRVILTPSGERAEYLVTVSLNDKEYSSWKRYEDFKELADACRDHSRMLELYSTSFRSGRYPSVVPLEETLEAWWQVESNRPWWSSASSLPYITRELPRIKHFMDKFLFEASNLRIIFEFMRSR